MNIHGDHSYWKQGTLGAAGVRCVWAGAGPQLAAYRGGVYRVASHTACLQIKCLCKANYLQTVIILLR